MAIFQIFSFRKVLKRYFARRDGQVRFYPFGALGRGWIVEELQVPNLERCVGAFCYGGLLLVVPYFLLLQHGYRLPTSSYFWGTLSAIYLLYWVAVWLFAQRGGRVRRVPEAVLLRDMALNQSAEWLNWRITASVILLVAAPIGALGMIGTAPLAASGLAVLAILYGFTLRRLLRVKRVQKEIGPHADTTAVFD